MSLRYGEPAGEPRLRHALAAKLGDFGVSATAAQIITTVGATHALDVVTRTLLRAGDSVTLVAPRMSASATLATNSNTSSLACCWFAAPTC